MVNCQDVDRVAIVGEGVALSTVDIIPAGDGGGSSDVRETWERALGGVALGEKTVGSVTARDDGKGAGGIIVASVVGNGDGRHNANESEDDGWELHNDFWLIGYLREIDVWLKRVY